MTCLWFQLCSLLPKTFFFIIYSQFSTFFHVQKVQLYYSLMADLKDFNMKGQVENELGNHFYGIATQNVNYIDTQKRSRLISNITRYIFPCIIVPQPGNEVILFSMGLP